MKKLTNGRPMILILGFAIPLLLGNVFQLFYNLADARIVGSTLGKNSFGALGATASINSVIVGFLNGLTNGFALLTARYFGARDKRKVKQTVAATIILGFATATLLTILSLVFINPLLKLLNTPEDIFDEAKSYIFIILAGMIISMCYNICAAILRAIGDTVMPLVFLIVATILNIGLDLLFICVFNMGVEGAAYATLLAQAISVVSCIIYILNKHKDLVPNREHFKLNRKLAVDMYTSGLAMGLMISLVGIGTVVLQGAINIFGTTTIISHTASRKISEIFMLPISVFGASAATFVGQNYGAGKFNRLRKGFYDSTLLTWIWSVLVIAICFAFTPIMVKVISGINSNEVEQLSRKYMMFNTLFYPVLGVVIVFRNALQGVGSKIFPVLSSIIELVGKVVIARLLAPKIGYTGIIICEPIVWIGMMIILGIGFFTNKELKKSENG